MNSNSTKIIVEVGQAHDGSIGIAHSFIDALAGLDIDLVKFQTHIAEAESSSYEPFRINFSYEDDTRFDYWKRMSFSKNHWESLKNHCEKYNFEFLSTPTCIAAVDLLEDIGIKCYKIGSGDLSNLLLLEKVCRTGKPIIISTGMSELDDITKSIDFISKFDNQVSILVCKSKYPTNEADIDLSLINQFKAHFSCKIGFSDHSGSIFPSLGAVALGAEIIEIHVSFHKKMFGPDSSSSLTIDEIKELVKGIRYIEKIRESSIEKNKDKIDMLQMRAIFEKSLCVNKNLDIGHIITFDDLESKKPSNMGIPCSDFKKALNKKLKTSKNKYDFLEQSDLE